MLQSGKYFDCIIENLNILREEIKSKASLGFTDLNMYCEDFIKTIFNITYGYNLQNLNNRKKNYPGIDLGDEAKGIAYQITSTKQSNKIDNTLKMSLEYEHYKTFATINIFILTNKQEKYTLKTATEPFFSFSANTNILDFDDFYADVKDLDFDRLQRLKQYIEKELPYYQVLIHNEGISYTYDSNEAKSKDTALIELSSSKLQSEMKSHLMWKLVLEINSFASMTTSNLYSAIRQNQLYKQNWGIMLKIFDQKNIKTQSNKAISFYLPLQRNGALNNLTEEAMQLKGNKMVYEFCQYNNSDVTVINFQPLNSLIYILLTIGKWHKSNSIRPMLKISIELDSSNDAIIGSSPFLCEYSLGVYKIEDNHFEASLELADLSNMSIYEAVQCIYSAFVSTNNLSSISFLTIVKKKFDEILYSLRTEFHVPE